MRNLKHEFGQYNDIVEPYLSFLVENSDSFYDSQIKNKIIYNVPKEKETLHKCIDNVEDFLYYYYQKSEDNFSNILSLIVNNVRTIACFPNNKRGLYGEADADNKIIYINPNLQGSNFLGSLERIELYIAHELGHIINNEWMKKCYESLNEFFIEKLIDENTAQLIYDGFSMLDESITQNRAEDFIYYISNKNRPNKSYSRKNNLFKGKSYLTNYDYYGELQTPTILFARTLRGIGKLQNDDEVLKKISDRALNPNFYNSILDEYSNDNQMLNFLKLFKLMGYLKRASYASFGRGDISYCVNSSDYISLFTNLATKMRDTRDVIALKSR